MTVRIINSDVLAGLAQLEDESVHCVVTSPPYWGLRDYGVEGQIGLETTFDEWLEKMVAIFQAVRRVLRKDGTAWVQMGDCYADGAKAGRGIKAKDLVGQPWTLALALRADGWWLRRDVVWSKPNAMPETVHDRPATAHEYLFLLTRSQRYAYDAKAIKEPVTGRANPRGNGVNKKIKVPSGWDTGEGAHGNIHRDGRGKPEYRTRQNKSFSGSVRNLVETRNKRSVWEVPIEGFDGAHFATFPPSLITPCILAGCPTGGTVLDPFGGAGTTAVVADRLGRDAVLIELNPDYAAMAERRIARDRLERGAGSMADVGKAELPSTPLEAWIQGGAAA